MNEPIKLWELLVPKYFPDNGAPPHYDPLSHIMPLDELEIPLEFHREWDAKVVELSEGLTIMRSVKGIWVNPDDKSYCTEPMILVRIACTQSIILKILKVTAQHYKQKSVMAYVVSEEVIFHNVG